MFAQNSFQQSRVSVQARFSAAWKTILSMSFWRPFNRRWTAVKQSCSRTMPRNILLDSKYGFRGKRWPYIEMKPKRLAIEDFLSFAPKSFSAFGLKGLGSCVSSAHNFGIMLKIVDAITTYFTTRIEKGSFTFPFFFQQAETLALCAWFWDFVSLLEAYG